MARRRNRYQVRGPHNGRQGSVGNWTVVDTEDKDIAVDVARTKRDAIEAARELNAKEKSSED